MHTKKDFLEIGEVVNLIATENKNKILTVQELKNVLGGIVPVNDLARGCLVKSEVILRVGKGKYAFPKDPIHWTCIKKFYDLSREKSKQYRNPENRKRRFVVPNSTESEPTTELTPEPTVDPKAETVAQPIAKVSVKELHTPEPIREPEYTEEKAIAFLKSKGYFIFKMM